MDRSALRHVATAITHVRRVWLVVAVAIAVTLVSIVTLDLGPVLRRRVEAEASAWVSRPVHIGRLGLNVGRGHLVLEDVVVEGGTPANDPWLRAGRIELALTWNALLGREVLFDDAVVDDWTLLIESYAGAVNNMPRLGGPPRPKRTGPPLVRTTLEKMATLKTVREGGRVTAAVSSQVSDGAAALLLASEAAVRTHGLTPLARIHALTVVGSDPIVMLDGPIAATERVLARAGLSIGDIDQAEVNEAFAPVVIAWLKATGADPARTNPLGGAIALGHPLGATGARLMVTLVHALRRSGGRYGLQTMCEGIGMANATVIERL